MVISYYMKASPLVNKIISGISTGFYYVYKVSNNRIKLSETYNNAINNPPVTINLIDVGGQNHNLSLVNPKLKLIKLTTIGIFISLFIEVTQIGIPGRVPDPMDFLANSAGLIFSGVITGYLNSQTRFISAIRL